MRIFRKPRAGTGSGVVSSVNNKTGAVVLAAADVGAAPAGLGLPSGGTAGQVLTKTGAEDGAAGWATLLGSGSAADPDATVIAIGDSVTLGEGPAAAPQGGPGQAWPAVLASARTWAVTINAGVSGSALAASGSDPMVSRYQAAVPGGYNGRVFLFGGTNDYAQNVPLGLPGTQVVSSVYGALRTLVSGIMGRCGPRATLTLITPSWRGDAGRTEGTRNTAGYTLEQVRQAVRDEAARGGWLYGNRVRLLDLGRDLRDWYALDPSNTYINTDLLHPTQAGQSLIGTYAAAHELEVPGVAVPPAPGTNYADDFNRADGPLGSNWTTTAPFAITGGVVGSTAAGPARFGPVVTQGTVGLDISTNAALVFGANANFSDYYALYRTDQSDTYKLHIYHQVNGVGTDVIGGVPASSAAGRQRFTVTINGTAITIRDSAGGVLYSGSIPGLQPGYTGMFMQPGNTADNFTLNVVS